jgi:hypothetical protein
LAPRKSRKRRKQRRRGERPRPPRPPGNGQGAAPRGYARARAKDERARAALTPLQPGERPTAVTVGAVVAACLTVANLVALVVGWDPDEPRKTVATATGVVVLAIVAFGMWRARYWAVLGMQTLLALTLLVASLGLIGAGNLWAVLLVLAIIAAAGTLFWFLVKAMARIQMPERPGARR